MNRLAGLLFPPVVASAMMLIVLGIVVSSGSLLADDTSLGDGDINLFAPCSNTACDGPSDCEGPNECRNATGCYSCALADAVGGDGEGNQRVCACEVGGEDPTDPSEPVD